MKRKSLPQNDKKKIAAINYYVDRIMNVIKWIGWMRQGTSTTNKPKKKEKKTMTLSKLRLFLYALICWWCECTNHIRYFESLPCHSLRLAKIHRYTGGSHTPYISIETVHCSWLSDSINDLSLSIVLFVRIQREHCVVKNILLTTFSMKFGVLLCVSAFFISFISTRLRTHGHHTACIKR